MSNLTASRMLPFVAACALFGSACGSSGASEPASDETSVAPVETDFELFSSDEGSGCVVYVSVPEDAVTEDTDVRALIWTGVVSTDGTECEFSDVVEVGLITVDGLDNYNQPDFSRTIDHGFYQVDGWDELVEQCGALPIDDSCDTLLQSSLTE